MSNEIDITALVRDAWIDGYMKGNGTAVQHEYENRRAHAEGGAIAYVEPRICLPSHPLALAVTALSRGAADTARLDHIAGEYLQVEPFDMPTGAGDADVGWRLSNFVQGKEGPQPLHLEFRDDLRAALDADRAAK